MWNILAHTVAHIRPTSVANQAGMWDSDTRYQQSRKHKTRGKLEMEIWIFTTSLSNCNLAFSTSLCLPDTQVMFVVPIGKKLRHAV